MEMQGEHRIPATRDKVWEALNSPEIMRKCIPGCETLEKTGTHEMRATVAMAVGPVKARFKGKVILDDTHAPDKYSVNGEGQGGVAGFGKGGADVTLVEDADGTILSYQAHAQVGGKLAQLGSRLIDSTARKLADRFFTNLVDHFSAADTMGETIAESAPAAAPATAEPAGRGMSGGNTLWIAAGVLVIVIIALFVVMR